MIQGTNFDQTAWTQALINNDSIGIAELEASLAQVGINARGDFGHKGRPGEVGGSLPSDSGGGSAAQSEYASLKQAVDAAHEKMIAAFRRLYDKDYNEKPTATDADRQAVTDTKADYEAARAKLAAHPGAPKRSTTTSDDLEAREARGEGYADYDTGKLRKYLKPDTPVKGTSYTVGDLLKVAEKAGRALYDNSANGPLLWTNGVVAIKHYKLNASSHPGNIDYVFYPSTGKGVDISGSDKFNAHMADKDGKIYVMSVTDSAEQPPYIKIYDTGKGIGTADYVAARQQLKIERAAQFKELKRRMGQSK